MCWAVLCCGGVGWCIVVLEEGRRRGKCGGGGRGLYQSLFTLAGGGNCTILGSPPLFRVHALYWRKVWYTGGNDGGLEEIWCDVWCGDSWCEGGSYGDGGVVMKWFEVKVEWSDVDGVLLLVVVVVVVRGEYGDVVVVHIVVVVVVVEWL